MEKPIEIVVTVSEFGSPRQITIARVGLYVDLNEGELALKTREDGLVALFASGCWDRMEVSAEEPAA